MCQDFRLIFDLTGVPVAWMLSSNTQHDTFTYFLNLVRVWSPAVRPTYFMTDCDQAQISAVETVFPQTHMLLCWWHVLHAIQSHFRTDHFPELWIQIKKLVRTTDVSEFGQSGTRSGWILHTLSPLSHILRQGGFLMSICGLLSPESTRLSMRKVIQTSFWKSEHISYLLR